MREVSIILVINLMKSLDSTLASKNMIASIPR